MVQNMPPPNSCLPLDSPRPHEAVVSLAIAFSLFFFFLKEWPMLLGLSLRTGLEIESGFRSSKLHTPLSPQKGEEFTTF